MTNSTNTSALKYEKTQNRDIIATIERINRSQQYKPLSERFIDNLGKSIYEFAVKEFRQQWRNKHDSHENPPNLNVEISFGSPIYRKNDEMAYHYIMTLSTTFYVDCQILDGETPIEAETRMSSWFFENIAQKINLKIVENAKSLFDSDNELRDIASFMLLQKVSDEEEGRIGSRKPVAGRINISYMTSIKAKKNDSMNSDVTPYKDGEMVRDGLISNIALAIERIKNNIVEENVCRDTKGNI